MTDIEIKKLTRTKILKSTIILLAALLILLLVGETKGDFANGILFFIEAVANIHIIVILIILLGLTYLFAGRAGLEIITERQNIFLISFKYVALISLTVSTYATLIAFFRQNDFNFNGLKNAMSLFFLPLFFKFSFWLLIVWIWVTYKIKSISV